MDYNPLDLSGEKYLITGAASGLGAATSILLSKLGADLLLVDINPDGLENTKSQCKASSLTLALDLTEISALKRQITEAVAIFGRLNGMVHLAGMPYIAPLKSINVKTATDVFLLNTMAGLELAKIFVNKNVLAEGLSSIVFISSIYGLVGSSANVGYAMSKSALHGITKSLAIELANKGVRVNCVAPGFIKTPMLTGVSDSFSDEYDRTLDKLHPLGLGEALDVANTIAFLLSGMSKWITGSIISVDGGFTAQ